MEFMMIHNRPQSGFAMLFTVLIISLILSIAVSISNLTLKQTVLSNLAKDSQIAFYQADAGVECGMYQDTALGAFPKDATIVPDSFECGDHFMIRNTGREERNNHYFFEFRDIDPMKPCFAIAFDKSSNTPYKVQGYGYNICNPGHPRQVERALEVKY